MSYYYTTYQNPKGTQFWFTLTELLTGKVTYTSATYPTLQECETWARMVAAEKTERARQDEADYLNSLK